MAKVIVWTKPDGSVSMSEPCEKYLPGETETEYLDRVSAKVAKAIPELAKVGYFEKAQLPASMSFFNQWRIIGGRPQEDPVLVKAEKWKRAKAKRDALLRASDEPYMSKIEDAKDAKPWGDYRKALRAIETTFTDPDAIVWPSPPLS